MVAMALLLAAELASAGWESEIRAFEAADGKGKPPKNVVVFVGSSSIRMWNLNAGFPNLKALNRGFGGSLLGDTVVYAHRIVTPYKPRTIVLYAGDNDIAAGRTPENVTDDFRRFVGAVRSKLPKTRILFLSIKPSLARWHLWAAMQQANGTIRDVIAADEKKTLVYVDCGTILLSPDGTPRKDFYMEDGLHLSAAGYAAWNGILKPLLN